MRMTSRVLKKDARSIVSTGNKQCGYTAHCVMTKKADSFINCVSIRDTFIGIVWMRLFSYRFRAVTQKTEIT